MKNTRYWFVLILLLVGVLQASADEAPDVKAAAKRVKQIIAHRGASEERPECTLSAIRRAIEVEATAVEVDVRTTRDGKLFILHDATLDRTTDGEGPANALTLAQLQKLDAGSWFDPKYRTERIPSLIEAAEACQDRIDLLLDLKEQGDDYDRKVVDIIRKHGDPKKTIVGVRSVAQAIRFRKLLPQARQLALIPSIDSIEDFAKAGVDTIRLWPRWLKDGDDPVTRVRATGKLLHLNGTMGELDETLGLLIHQPDSLSSDHPAQLKRTLAKIAGGAKAPASADESKPIRPIPVAHRGLLRHTPENTLPAFAACLELGIGFELDVRTTKDGHLVVLHDDNVQRTTNGPSRSVRDMTLHEVKRLDAGSWFDKAYTGVRVPTLEETLSLVRQRKRGSTIIALNVKDVTRAGEAKLVALVEKYDLVSESFAFDQSDEMSRRLKKLNPAFRIGQNVNRQSIEARLKEGLLDCFLLTSTPKADEVRRLHKHGKQVLFNYAGEKSRDSKAWKQAADAGVDGLLTDYPLECRSAWRTAAGSAANTPLDPRGVWVETPWATPVIDRGIAGAWDHMAVDNPYVHAEDDKFFCFYEAQDKPIASGGREAFGIAISHDGTTWKKLPGNPILTTGDDDAWDHIVAKLPVGVIKSNDLYHLFYSGRDSRTKQIGLATARELTGPWTKSPDNPVLKSRTGKWDKVLSTHPAPVFEIEGRYHLLFRGMQRRYERQGVGLAVSADLRHWHRSADTPMIPVSEEIASLAVAQVNQRFVAISQPTDLQNRSYWFSDDLKQWRKGPAVSFRASIKAETLSNPFLSGGHWTVLYEQKDRIYRAVLQPATHDLSEEQANETQPPTSLR